MKALNTFKHFQSRANLKRQFSTSVYIWTDNTMTPKVTPKSAGIKQQWQMNKGLPQRVTFFDDLDVKTLRIGFKHSAVISGDGSLYMFGQGNYGVLGQGNENEASFKAPVKVTKFEKEGLKVVDVALGEYHTIALTDDGSVWTWGYGGKDGFMDSWFRQQQGALGLGDQKSHYTPQKVKFFDENEIKVKSIAAGQYFCNVITDKGEIYSWGRGQYGALGNGSNKHSLLPKLNEEAYSIQEDSEENKIIRMETADESTIIQTALGELYAWGKNDRGQLGTGPGIGMDMVECENVPTRVDLQDENQQIQFAKRFEIGQNSMLIQDTNSNIYLVGQKLEYVPKLLHFDESIFDINNIKLMGCGRKHYMLVTNDNNIMAWGNVFKEKSDTWSEGFNFYYGDALFDNGSIEQLEVKYTIFGALVKH